MSLAEKRTQIYLPLNLFGSLRKEARLEKKSMAQVIREALVNYLEQRKIQKINWEKDPINKIVGAIAADRDLSTHHDKYLYGK